MKLKYLAIALAIAGVAASSAPATAGSVGVKGGSRTYTTVIDKTNKVETVKNVVNENTVNKTKDVYKTATGTTTTVKGTDIITKGSDIVKDGKTTYQVTAYGVHDIFGGSGSKDAAKTYNYDSRSDALKGVSNMAINAVKTGRSMYTMSNFKYSGGVVSAYTTQVGNAKLGWNKNEDLTGGKKVADGKAVKGKVTYEANGTKETISTKERIVDSTGKTTKDVKETTTSKTEKTGQTDTLTSIKYIFSNDGIVVGDSDNMGGAYNAQGNMTQENHYDRTEYYLTTNTTDRTITNTTEKIHTTYTDTVKTVQNKYISHQNYTQNYVYKVDMPVSVTPIVLDLDGDGKIEASNGQYLPHAADFSKNVVMFDFHGNGFPVAMEWVGTNDGLLCRPNADGTVNGTNLFGSANGYANGYDELASLDTNRDGSLNGAELAGLMVWQDANHNGVADKGELKSLEELGITSIGTKAHNLSCDFVRNGQVFKSFDWNPNVQNMRKVNVAR